MTTLVVSLPVVLARRLARAADQLGLSHDELARVALRLFLRAADDAPPPHLRAVDRGAVSASR